MQRAAVLPHMLHHFLHRVFVPTHTKKHQVTSGKFAVSSLLLQKGPLELLKQQEYNLSNICLAYVMKSRAVLRSYLADCLTMDICLSQLDHEISQSAQDRFDSRFWFSSSRFSLDPFQTQDVAQVGAFVHVLIIIYN